MTSQNVYTVVRQNVGSAEIYFTRWAVVFNGVVVSTHATRERASLIALECNRAWVEIQAGV